MAIAINVKPKIASVDSMFIAKLSKDLVVCPVSKVLLLLKSMKDVPRTLLVELGFTFSAFLQVVLLQTDMFYASCQMCWLISFRQRNIKQIFSVR